MATERRAIVVERQKYSFGIAVKVKAARILIDRMIEAIHQEGAVLC